jgi:hypothetical protein
MVPKITYVSANMTAILGDKYERSPLHHHI